MPMNQNGDIWEIELDLSPGKHEYIFLINGWSELGSAPLASECDYNPCDEFANYGFLLPSGSPAINLETVCWRQCLDCSILSITDSDKRSVNVYPNPVDNQITIETDFAHVKEFEIYSILGELKMRGKLSLGANTVHLSVLDPGIYILNIENQSIKLIKTM